MAQGGLDITTCLEALSRRLVDAAAVAQAAVTCARAGAEREAVAISVQLDLLLGEAQTLHGAICLISVEAAASGTLPRGFGISRLTDLPPCWDEQRRLLGIAR